MTTTDDVIAVFHEALDLPPDTDMARLSYLGHANWNSLGHMSLVAALEERFDIMLDADDILAMSSVDKAVAIVTKHRALD